MAPPSDVNSANNAFPAEENAGRAIQPRAMTILPVPVTHSPPALTAAPSAVSLLKALQRRLGPALLIGLLLAAAVGTAVWFLYPPPQIAARMLLHVDPAPQRLIFPDSETSASQQNEAYMRTQSFLIRDRFVLTTALRNPEVANLPLVKEKDDPVQWLETSIVVDFPSPEFMRIILNGDRPDDQKTIVKAVANAYLDNVVNKERNERIEKKKKLETLQLKLEQESQAKKKLLHDLQEKAQGFNEEGIVVSQQFAQEELMGVKQRIMEVRHELLVLSIELGLHPDWQQKVWPEFAAALNCQLGPGLPVNQAFTALLHDEYLVALASPNASGLNKRELEAIIDKDQEIDLNLKEIQQSKEIIARMRTRLYDAAYEQQSKPWRKRVTDLEQKVEARRKQLRPEMEFKLRHRLLGAAQSDQRKRDEKYRLLKATESKLLQLADELTEKSKERFRDGLHLTELIEQIDTTKNLVQRTNAKITAMEVERESPPRITKPSDEAFLFIPEMAKRKLSITGGSALAALVLVLLAFAWFEFQSRKVYTPDEVVQGLGLHLVGTVPDHSPRRWLPWSRNNETDTAYTQSMLTESVDTARTLLLHVARKEQLQIVMITSALAGEGKTSLASHLAASLARAGRRTILVDSDLRNPTLHRLFDRSRAPGLSEYLRGEIDLAGVTSATAIPNLWLISAGKADAAALQTLAFDVVPKLFEQLRLHYDFIIVDSCPVLPVADAMLVGQHVDAVIFSLLREVSRLPRVHAAYQRLSVLGIRMLGAVVNGTQHDRYPADYHYIAQDQEQDQDS